MKNIETTTELKQEELQNVNGGYGLLDFINDAINLYNTAKRFTGGNPQL